MMKKTRIWEIGILTALVGAYAVFLSMYFVPVVGNVDANGYIVSARLFQEHGRFSQVPQDDYAFVGRMWVENSSGEYFPKYPPLYSALAGLVMMGFGMNAGFYVAPACAVLALLGMYALCRTQFSAGLSLLGALALAVNPVFNVFALRQMSHAPSMCFLIWAYATFFYALLREKCRPNLALVLISGLLLGCSVGIRYTNALLAIPPILIILSGTGHKRWSALRAYLAGFAVPCILLAGYHWRAFGGPFTTGYALSGEQSSFGWTYLAAHVRRFAAPLVRELMGPAAVLSLAGLVILWMKSRRRAVFFLIWIVPVSLLYMSYYWAPDLVTMTFLRFLLPAVVPGILLALVCLNEITRRVDRRRTAKILGAAVLAGLLGWWGISGTLPSVEKGHAKRVIRKSSVDFINGAVPAGSVVFGHRTMLLALDAGRVYTLYPSVILDRQRMAESVANPERPLTIELQKERVELLEGTFSGLDRPTYASKIRSLLDRSLSGSRGVFVVGNSSVIRRSLFSLPAGYALEAIAQEPRRESSPEIVRITRDR